jgi:D-tyrosyl-tRNA(Tyr) deacylase
VRAVAQRVTAASVAVAGQVVARIGRGLCVFAAAGRGDGPEDIAYLADKLAHLRVFPEDGGAVGRARMVRSLLEVGGELLLVPQFTLYGDVRRGRRPDFTGAAPPEEGRSLLAALAGALRARGVVVQEGVFGADMCVRADNDGPVTVLLDSRRTF